MDLVWLLERFGVDFGLKLGGASWGINFCIFAEDGVQKESWKRSGAAF